MRVFVKVAEAGSFSAASRELQISSQMVGRYVTDLEQRLGARLLNRTTHSQSLTDTGRQYLEGCRAALSQIADLDLGVSVRAGTVQGLLRVSAPLGLGTVLAPRLATLLETHPSLRLELHLSDQNINLASSGFDAAIRIGDLPDSELIARRLGLYRCVTCASPDYLRRRGTPARPEDLRTHECLDFIFPTHPSPELWTFSRDDEVVRIEPEARLLMNDGRALIEAGLSGLGVIQVGEIKVRHEIATGRLVRLLPDWECPVRPLQLVMPSSRLQSPALRTFGDWLAGVISDQTADRTGS